MNGPVFSSLSLGTLIQVLLSDQRTRSEVLKRANLIGCEEDDLYKLAEWHLNKYQEYTNYGYLECLGQQASEPIALFLSWLIAPLRNLIEYIEIEADVNVAIKKQWREYFDITAEVIKKQEIVLAGWSIGNPIWSNRKNFPATYFIDQLGQDIALAYAGLLEHLALHESEFNQSGIAIPEVTRTSVVWRFTGLFEALADTAQGPKIAIEQITVQSRKSLPDSFRRISGQWPESLVKVRNAFSHIRESLKSQYEVPTTEWVLQLVERGTSLTGSALSQYFESEIPDETARSWFERSIDETNY